MPEVLESDSAVIVENKWILEFRRDERAPWLPFGLPHDFDSANVRLDDVRARMTDSEWRLVNCSTGGLYHGRPDHPGYRPA